MSETARVRTAVPADLQACAELIARSDIGTVNEWRARFAAFLAAGGFMVVAADAGAVVGYGRARLQSVAEFPADPPPPAGFYLCGVVVAESRRGRGIGTALCRTRIDWASTRADELWFFTNQRNVTSRRMHERLGFQAVRIFSSPDLAGGVGILGRLTFDASGVDPKAGFIVTR